MITKKNFHRPKGNLSGDALTLKPKDVAEGDYGYNNNVIYSRKHESGWTIYGKIYEDWCEWVNEFAAFHDEFGMVAGDFESKVVATSEEAFQHFWEHHEPKAIESLTK